MEKVTKMEPLFKGRHLITLEDWSKPEIDKLLEVSKDLKYMFHNDIPTPFLENKTGFLMFLNNLQEPVIHLKLVWLN